jgi:hypothetical protein
MKMSGTKPMKNTMRKTSPVKQTAMDAAKPAIPVPGKKAMPGTKSQAMQLKKHKK